MLGILSKMTPVYSLTTLQDISPGQSSVFTLTMIEVKPGHESTARVKLVFCNAGLGPELCMLLVIRLPAMSPSFSPPRFCIKMKGASIEGTERKEWEQNCHNTEASLNSIISVSDVPLADAVKEI